MSSPNDRNVDIVALGNVLIDLNWFLRWAIWFMGLLLVMHTLRGVKRNYVGPLKIQWLANSSKRIFYLFEWFYNHSLICSIDLLICKNELLICPNKENFSFYLASLRRRNSIHINLLIWHYINQRKLVHKTEIRQECWHK